jgi:hypothetical protein
MNVLVNALVFKVAWVSTIFGGANELPLFGPLVVMIAVAIHLWRAAEPHRELALVVLTGAIGLAWDSVMVAAGWLSYPSGTFVAGLAPYWIVGMWMLFATTLNVTFRWCRLRSHVLLGRIGGRRCPAHSADNRIRGAVRLLGAVDARPSVARSPARRHAARSRRKRRLRNRPCLTSIPG